MKVRISGNERVSHCWLVCSKAKNVNILQALLFSIWKPTCAPCVLMVQSDWLKHLMGPYYETPHYNQSHCLHTLAQLHKIVIFPNPFNTPLPPSPPPPTKRITLFRIDEKADAWVSSKKIISLSCDLTYGSSSLTAYEPRQAT